MEKSLTKQELEEKIKNLVGIEKWYYDSLPDVCLSKEDTQVNNLRAKGVNIARTKLRRVKNTLIKEGLLQLETLPNGNRKNLKHILRKTYPIRLVERLDMLVEREDPYIRYTPEDEEYTLIYNIQWGILQKYTAQEINSMDRIARIQLYMDCGFIVLPTAYPVFTENEVKCSCSKGINCPSIGKHPIQRYKYIDPFNYECMKDHYLEEFKNNPDLNVGFKVMGYSVLDVDNKNAGDQSLAHLLREYEINMENVISVKCSNGQHIYANNTHLKNTAGVLGNGLDVRSEGGFVVAPGSVHKSGTVYQWNEIGEVATMPNDWFYTETEENEISGKKSSNGSNQTAGEREIYIKLPKNLTSKYVIKEGERELTLFRWACRKRGNGANAEQIFDFLITMRNKYCEEGEEPVTDEEVRDIADCVARNFPTNAQKKLSSFDPQN
jgi:hypothetical protein